jgi:hypothetical protein
VKKFAVLLLLAACNHSPTGIGEVSRCQKTTEATQTFRLAGQTQAYAMEIGACVYPVSGTAVERDSVHITFSLENVVNRRVR